MTDDEKKAELQKLLDILCDFDFSKDNNKIEEWIQRLNKIYANDYRHTYSDIFFKLQKIIASSDSEVLETLGENLDVLREKILILVEKNKDDANLRNTLAGYNKLADHINLEIGRYNFIKNHFSNVTVPSASSPSDKLPIDTTLAEKVDKLSDDLNNMRHIATQAQKGLEQLDPKLESNKISSITALTIFSAVVLAFSGGITFEVGMLQGMATASAYRLVFVIALTGFVLFNTIFMLLYLVGKLSGKSIGTQCQYCTSNSENNNCKCGEGVCTKELSNGNIFCRITHKYFYVLVVNVILLLVMYDDFFLWLSNGEILNEIFVLSQVAILFSIFVYFIYKLIKNCVYDNRNKLQFKVEILQEIVAPDEKNSSNIIVCLEKFSKLLFNNEPNYLEKYKSSIVGLEYKEALKKLNSFAEEQLLNKTKKQYKISSEKHRANKRKWKRYKKLFKHQFEKNKKTLKKKIIAYIQKYIETQID